jgi:farnesol dehydrogenase
MLLYFFIQIVERFNGRLPGYIGSGNDRFSFSHVDDVVEGHIAAMNKGRPGERYLLTGENASFRHVFDMAAIITETQKPMFNIPMLVIEAYGWVSVLFSRITGKLPLISPPVCSVVFEIAFLLLVSVLSRPLREFFVVFKLTI